MKDLTPTRRSDTDRRGLRRVICEGLMATPSHADQAPIRDARDTLHSVPQSVRLHVAAIRVAHAARR